MLDFGIQNEIIYKIAVDFSFFKCFNSDKEEKL